jgi:phosphoserine/homoserine phosphotransferase
VETLEWLKSRVPRAVLLTDTFEDYAMPMFEMLGYPPVFCHSLEVDGEGYITKHVLRLRDQKRKSVEAFQRLGHKIIAVGDSFNDISMLKAAEHGILYCPAQKVIDAHPEFPVVQSHEELRDAISQILSPNEPALKLNKNIEEKWKWSPLSQASTSTPSDVQSIEDFEV